MCGRYTLTHPDQLALRLDLPEGAPAREPSYNVAPAQTVPVVSLRSDGQRALRSLHWGFAPTWFKEGTSTGGDDDAVVAVARAGDEAAFGLLAECHRRELQMHCSRLRGFKAFVATELAHPGGTLVLFTIRSDRWLTADFSDPS
jgi:hypothetical protein